MWPWQQVCLATFSKKSDIKNCQPLLNLLSMCFLFFELWSLPYSLPVSAHTLLLTVLRMVVFRLHIETRWNPPHESGLLGVLVPTNPHPPSISGMSQVCLLLILLFLCSCTKVRTSSHLTPTYTDCSKEQQANRGWRLRFLNTVWLFYCSSPLLTHWSMWKSSGAATKTNAWTTSVLQHPPQVSLSAPSASWI